MRGRPSTGPRRPWTDAEVQLLRKLYPDQMTRDIAARLGRAERAVAAKAAALGLRKSETYLASPAAARIQPGDGKGSATRFRPGMTPWNKGSHYVAGGRSIETRFKPGQTPHTHKPIGSEAWRDGYLWRKVSEDRQPARFNWREVHRIVWEEHNGPVPAGHAVVFINRDRSDIRLDNLELISRQELARRNTMHRLPPELRKVIRTKGTITRQINKLKRANA